MAVNQRGPISVTWTVKPGNSESVIVIDSTRWPSGPTSGVSQHATTGSFLTPGQDRGFLSKAIVNYTVKAATSDVTVLDQLLTGVAGTSADWETTATGSHTVTAGSTTSVTFTPTLADWRIRIDAGGTGPTALVVRVNITFNA